MVLPLESLYILFAVLRNAPEICGIEIYYFVAPGIDFHTNKRFLHF